jgi:MerR family transcriptional regulator/heat shock protein HspR
VAEKRRDERRHGRNRPVYVISVAAELTGLHPQTLRAYDRLGLVSPGRTPGQGRRYSDRDIDRLRQVQQLSQDEGVNLAGIKVILGLYDQITALRSEIADLQRQLDAAREELRRERGGYGRDLLPRDPAMPWTAAPSPDVQLPHSTMNTAQ